MLSAAHNWRFHPDRDRLLAEAHARPSPRERPAVGGQDRGPYRAKVAAAWTGRTCRRSAARWAPNRDRTSRSCILDAGAWRLRWERRTEMSTWTALRPNPDGDTANFAATALDLVPQDWLAELPGEVLAAAHVALVRAVPKVMLFADEDLIASSLAGNSVRVFTDFRPGPTASPGLSSPSPAAARSWPDAFFNNYSRSKPIGFWPCSPSPRR